jgi:hypothetical protein
MQTDESDDRETFSSPACSMHEFEDELVPRSVVNDAKRGRFLRLSLAGLGAAAAFYGSIRFVRRVLSRARRDPSTIRSTST